VYIGRMVRGGQGSKGLRLIVGGGRAERGRGIARNRGTSAILAASMYGKSASIRMLSGTAGEPPPRGSGKTSCMRRVRMN